MAANFRPMVLYSVELRTSSLNPLPFTSTHSTSFNRPGGQFKRRLNRSCLVRHVRCCCCSIGIGFGFSSAYWVATSKDASAKTLQPLQGHAEARWRWWWLAILWRHLSKVTRNYDYVRAQRVSGVALGGLRRRGWHSKRLHAAGLAWLWVL